MAGRSGPLVGAALAVLALLAGACGTAGSTTGDECDTSGGTLTVGLIAPLSGPLAEVGLGMRNSADLAVRQANERCLVPGHDLALQARDDRADPATAEAAATELAADPQLVGVVGTYNSATAQTVQPVLARAGIVMISPGNTNVSLTRGANAVAAPLRQYETYFRVVPTDAVQGPAAADHLAEVGLRRVAVVSDGGTYGEGIASEFAKQLPTRGGEVVLRTVLPAGTPPDAVTAEVLAARPDAVFYGGEYPDAGPLSQDLAGAAGPLVGGDGVVNPGYVAAGGRDGDLGTSVSEPPESDPRATDFVAAYRQAGYAEGFGAYGTSAFDATNVLATSLARVVGESDGGEWSDEERPALGRAVQAYDGEGVTGSLVFDRFGDVSRDEVTVYRLAAGRWVPDTPLP